MSEMKRNPNTRFLRQEKLPHFFCSGCGCGQVLNYFTQALDSLGLSPEEFSVDLFGRVFTQLRDRHREGLAVSLGALEGLSPEETSHMAAVSQKDLGPVSEEAFRDCVAAIRREYRLTHASSLDEMMAIREQMKERKRYQ